MRKKRVAQLVQSTLSQALLEEVSDPALQHATIVSVELSGDLKNAKVYYQNVVLEGQQDVSEKEMREGWKRATPFLKRKLGESHQLRYIPSLRFILDNHWEQVHKMMGLIEGQGDVEMNL